MNQEDQAILEAFAEQVRSRFPFARIWAFGSRARESSSPDSDLDVCVVVGDLTEAVDREIMSMAWEVGFESDVVIATVTFSEAEFSDGPLAASPLVRAIRREGIAA